MICEFITSITCLITIDWVLYQSELLVFSCIGLKNEHLSSFVYVIEVEVNAETDEMFYFEMLPFIDFIVLWF